MSCAATYEKCGTITLPLPFHMGSVNCYLVAASQGFILIDTGGSNSRKNLIKELENAGCKPGLLKLILITHGDFDHTGNATYLRNLFGCRIAMHEDDLDMAQFGDMFANRKKPNILLRKLIPLFSGFGKDERFQPDFFVKNGDDLSEHGFDARILSIPGHSRGSIGILTAQGDLFCGDLLENLKTPVLGSLTDDLLAARESILKLRDIQVNMVYPGHGKPFPMPVFMEGNLEKVHG